MQAPVRSGEAAGSMAPVAPVGPVALERGAASASSARPDVSVPVVDDAPDELPAVGKVAAEGATRSLWQAFKKSGGPRPPTRGVTDDAGPDNGSSSAPDEPAHLRDLRTHVLARLTPRLAAMFDGARLIDFDDATGLARLYFPAEAAGQAAFVKKNREQYALAFAEECGRAVSLEFEVEPEPVVAAAPVEQKSRVVRPDLDAIAAEAKDEPLTPMLDVDAVKDDPLVAAVLKAFDGSRIVKVE